MTKRRTEPTADALPADALIREFEELVGRGDRLPPDERGRFHNRIMLWVVMHHEHGRMIAKRAAEAFVLKMKNARRHRPEDKKRNDKWCALHVEKGLSPGQIAKLVTTGREPVTRDAVHSVLKARGVFRPQKRRNCSDAP